MAIMTKGRSQVKVPTRRQRKSWKMKHQKLRKTLKRMEELVAKRRSDANRKKKLLKRAKAKQGKFQLQTAQLKKALRKLRKDTAWAKVWVDIFMLPILEAGDEGDLITADHFARSLRDVLARSSER